MQYYDDTVVYRSVTICFIVYQSGKVEPIHIIY